MTNLQSQIDALFDDAKNKSKSEHDALTLATLCDMVLGEDATDRSDWALIQAVGRLQRQLEAARYLFGNSTARNDFNYFDGTWNIELYMDSETWERFKNQLVGTE